MSRDKENYTTGSLDYYLFRTALKLFQLPPAELTSAQFELTQRLALSEHALVSRILSSEEVCNIAISDQVRNASMAMLEARYECREDFLADLERNGLDKKVLLQALQVQLKVEAVLKHIGSRVARVTEQDAERYYHLHKERFEQPETRTVRHILITVNDDFPENRAATAYSRINQILQRVRNKSSRFAEQSRKHSECPSALGGGMLGRIPRGRLYPALDSVLFDLRLGEISDVVKSPVGLHIIFCEAIHLAKVLPLKEVLPRIIDKLTERRQLVYQQSWVSSLRS
jgi:nitrogen fixation protein NifM